MDPAQVFPEARSALVLGSLYRDRDYEAKLSSAQVKISRYAAGRDYHKVLRKRGKRLLAAIQERYPGTLGRITVDSAPVAEKVLGREAGIGWVGKHTNLIDPLLGSYFFISVLLLNLEPAPGVSAEPEEVESPFDLPQPERCGQCTLCLDACPTGALKPYRIDARRCLSYLTIELDENMPSEFRHRTEGWAFGCDICQEVCPYNTPAGRRTEQTAETDYQARKAVLSILETGESPTGEADWDELTLGSPIRRISQDKLRDNIDAAKNTDPEDNPSEKNR